MSMESRTYGQMVSFVFDFTGLHNPFLTRDEFPSLVSLFPERIFTRDDDDIYHFLESLRPPPPGCHVLLKEFITFQLSKPMRTYDWLAEQISDNVPGVISVLPNETLSYLRDSQEIERFMRSLRCEYEGEIHSLESECEPGSREWRQVIELLDTILHWDNLQYKSETENL